VTTVASAHNKIEHTALKKTKEELSRKGDFYLAFPNENYLYYKKFFQEARPLNDIVYTNFFDVKTS